MILVIDILSWTLLAGGSFVILTGSIGLLRMPDFFTRTHTAGLIDTLGATLIVGGLILQSGFTQVTIKLVVVLFFLLLTSPTAAHALVKAAYAQDVRFEPDEEAADDLER